MRGTLTDGVASYKGIPYAKAPVGSLRWAAPRAPDTWVGERRADSFGSHCAQFTLAGSFAGSEDCLYINVWVPQRSTSDLLPVFVFLHGGANITGSGDMDLGPMAKLGPVITISLNYRLGPFGFLAHPALAAEDAHHSGGNYAILDQIAALKWVQQNIRQFGGDPGRVLLSGQSAGAHDTSVLLASPLAKGLFSAAGIMSHSWTVERPIVVENTARVAAKFLGCDTAADVAACLRSKTAVEVAAVPGSLLSNFQWDPSCVQASIGLACRYSVASVDGYVLPDTPRNIVRAGLHNAVPTLIGTTALEWTTAVQTGGLQNTITSDASYQMQLRSELPTALADAIYQLYPSSAYGSALLAYIVAEGDVHGQCPARDMLDVMNGSQQAPVWQYLWNHTWDSGPNRQLGPGHGTDLPFVLQTYSPGSLSATEIGLASAMSGAWLKFAATHDPESSALPWPPYQASDPRFLVWQIPPVIETGLRHHECDLLEAAGFDWEWLP